MWSRHWLAGLIGMVLAAPAAMAATFAPDYLEGRWTTGSVEGCTRAEHEQTVFRKDGTFATEHKGKALAVGFWAITDEDQLEMHILTSEASLPQELQDALPGDYHALQVKSLVFDVGDNAFKLVQSINGDVQGLDMVRCPAS
ncbi:MAG: hypothetical protein ACJ8H8_35250 [Geminicoccaceae bacterium]|jgi:hypothetical protein